MQGRFCGHTDIPLSMLGRREAHKLASQLQHRPIAAIYSSDLSRAGETAEIIAQKLAYKKDNETTNVLRETARVSLPIHIILSSTWREINFGVWEGLTYDEIVTSFNEQLGFFTNPERIAPPQGETLAEVVQRVIPALYEIMQRVHGGEIVLVSHGGTLRGLLCSLLGMPLRNQWQLHIDTGSLSAIDVSLNEHGELLTSLVGFNVAKMKDEL
ncbi:MAG: alpha-ribazole phosphatase [Ktedonobacteraceae bacterium]